MEIWEYWRAEDGEVFAFNVADQGQIEAKEERLSQGVWENITGRWPPEPASVIQAVVISTDAK